MLGVLLNLSKHSLEVRRDQKKTRTNQISTIFLLQSKSC